MPFPYLLKMLRGLHPKLFKKLGLFKLFYVTTERPCLSFFVYAVSRVFHFGISLSHQCIKLSKNLNRWKTVNYLESFKMNT